MPSLSRARDVASAAEAERILRADEALSGSPDSLPFILEAAAAREAVWRYQEAVDLYRRAEVVYPEEWRLPLGLGHRLIRLRRNQEAVVALERALALDPEGDPRTCRDVAEDPASRVALTSWAYRALRRAGRHDEAAGLVADIPEGMEISDRRAELYAGSPIPPDDNTHYYLTLLYFQGRMSEADVLSDPRVSEGQWPTVAYAVAVHRLAEGDTARAVQLMDSVVAQPFWARLGHAAAEADLIRLPGTPSR